MIDVPNIQISDEIKETDKIARALIAMMADEEHLVLGNIAGGKNGDTEENVEVLSFDMALSSTLKIEIDVKIYDPFFPLYNSCNVLAGKGSNRLNSVQTIKSSQSST